MTDLHAIVYVSTATHLLCPAELNRLLSGARACNARESVTGLLLYRDGSFMQYVEGPADGLATVWRRIKADPQHHGIVELWRTPIRAREFGDWAMHFRDTSAFGVTTPPPMESIFAPAKPACRSAVSPASTLLSSFWHQRGRLVAF